MFGPLMHAVKLLQAESVIYDHCTGTIKRQEAQLSLTNCAILFCKVVEVLQDFLSENVDKKFTTDYNVA